jgi:hypothetical protein
MNLKLNLSKCEFAKTNIGFLGHVVSRDGTPPNQQKIKTIIELPMLTIVTNIKTFFNLIGYYYNYVKGYSHIATPLFELTKKDIMSIWMPLDVKMHLTF